MMGRILAVASNTRREAFRNRAFVVIVVLGLLLMAAGWSLSKLAVTSQSVRVIQNFGYFAVSFTSSVTAIMMGVILLYKELDRKTIFTLIPKPVMRYEIILGKFLGLVTLIIGLIAFLGLCWMGVMSFLDALEVAGQPVTHNVLASLVLMAEEAILVTGLALLFSSWTRPFLSGLFTFGYWLMGRTVFLLHEHLAAKNGALSEDGPLRSLVEVIVLVIPDLQVFNVSRELALGIDVNWSYVMASGGYSLGFTAIFLAIAVVLFSRRDFV
jgi:Cu-processing system permease protein